MTGCSFTGSPPLVIKLLSGNRFMTFKEEYMAPEVVSLELFPELPLAYSGNGETEDIDAQSDWKGGWS